MALTSGRPESGSKSDALQFQEGMAAVGSEENQSVSADWLAADWLAGSMSICHAYQYCQQLVTNCCFLILNYFTGLDKIVLSCRVIRKVIGP